MHDIVKAVGNCSYNQLVEKIISCKQSDNSELAGEGEKALTCLTPLFPSETRGDACWERVFGSELWSFT